MKNFLSLLFVSFCLAVSAEAESVWLVSPNSYLINNYNGTGIIYNYSDFSKALTVDIEQLSANEYSISDFFGGYLAQGENYDANYAMHGTFTIDTFGNIIGYSSFVDGWGESADNIRGSFNTTTQTLSLVVNYSGYLEFHVMVSKVELLTRSINVAEAGSLSSLITADEQSLIGNLTLTGNLNGTDLAFIGNMPFLSSLNLADARIVAGGTPDSKQDTLGSQLNNARLKELYLPASLTAVGDYNNGYGYNEGNYIFYTLPLLERIEASTQSTVFSSAEGILYNKAKTKLIAAPRGISSWVIIPEGVTEIAILAFGYCTKVSDIILPQSLTTIGYQAFDECHALTSVNIPANVTQLGVGVQDLQGNINDKTLSNPFTFCHGLQRITVSTDNPAFSSSDSVLFSKDGHTLIAYPESKGSVYDIPQNVNCTASNAFAGCYNVTNVTIPESVTTLGRSTFWCTGLTSVVIPGSIHRISPETFYNCFNLADVTISGGVDSIAARAFEHCSILPKITLPGSVEVIENSAFANCSSLKEVYIQRTDPPIFVRDNYGYGDSIASFAAVNDDVLYVPKGYKNIYLSATGWNSFSTIIDNLYVDPTKYTIDNLTYYVNADLPNTVTLSGYNEKPTGKLTIPSSVSIHGADYAVNSIYSYAFFDCDEMTSVEIPNAIHSIGSGAFEYCSGLTSIEIPNSVTFINGSSFFGCKLMKSITVDPRNTYYCDIEGVLYTINKDTLISYPNAKGLSYSIPNSVTAIGFYSFGGCDITSVTIPNSVNSIGGWAFEGCSRLASVEIPSSMTSIQEGTFYACNGLTSMKIPNTIHSIGSEAFGFCTGLTSIEIPNTVNSIGSYVFDNCTGLTSIEIPSSVTSIQEGTFYTCKGLASMKIPNTINSIGSGAFENCTNLTSMAIPSSVTSIESWAFAFCDNLKSITVDPGNTYYCDIEGVLYTIHRDTLVSYPNAKGPSYSIPNSTTTIGIGAFTGCIDMTSIIIPNSVSSIINWAFEYCESMKSITLPSSVTSICGDVFYNCDSLTSIISESSTPPNVGWTFYGIDTSGVTLYVPLGSKNAYSSTIGWRDFTNIVEIDMEAVKSQTYEKAPMTKIYYSVSGKETGSAQKGINIVKELYRDGSSRSYKIIVR